jgi:hypothetical protein
LVRVGASTCGGGGSPPSSWVAVVEVLGSVVCGSGGVASAGVVVFSSVFIRASRILRVPYREL